MPHLDPGRLAFIDETYIKTNMAPIRGWSLQRKRIIGFAPDGRWKTPSCLAKLRVDVTVPRVIDGPIKGELFQLYVEQLPVPTLRPKGHRDHP